MKIEYGIALSHPALCLVLHNPWTTLNAPEGRAMDFTTLIEPVTKRIAAIVRFLSSGRRINDLMDEVATLRAELSRCESVCAALTTEKRQLETKLDEVKDWNAQIARYELHPLSPGVLVYALKEGVDPIEPQHYICPNCVSEQQKSIIQRARRTSVGTAYVCPRCGAEFIDFGEAGPAASGTVRSSL